MNDFENSVREEVERIERNKLFEEWPTQEYQILMVEKDGSGHEYETLKGVVAKIGDRIVGIHKVTDSDKWGNYDFYVVTDLATGGQMCRGRIMGYKESCDDAVTNMQRPGFNDKLEGAKEMLQDSDHYPLNNIIAFRELVSYVHGE